MPGQRKREVGRQKAAARFAEAGHWDVLIETQDESDWHAQVRRLRAENQQIDWTAVRPVAAKQPSITCGLYWSIYSLRLTARVINPKSAAGG
ncbi:hypothetical protein [Streptacidiphilus sp. PAMC 29251]